MSCLITPAARSQVEAADAEFEAGISAKDKGDVNGAIQHLQRAVALDPKMIKAHFAIGAIAELWCYGSEGEALCKLALKEYTKVLELDGSRNDVLKNIAYGSYVVDQIDQAESYYRKALTLDPNDPEALGGVAAIDQRRAYRDEVGAKIEHKVPLEKPLIDSPSCEEVRQRNLARIEEGIALLTRALRIHTDESSLMSFLSALYRHRAEIQCGNPRAYKADKSAARKWNHMVHETLKKRKPGDPFLRRIPPAPPPAPDGK
jgi:tetratricopeptide (TPR) repeat protein